MEHFLFLNDLVVIPEFLPALFRKNNSYLHNSVHDTAHFSALNSIDYLGRFLPMQRFPWRYCSTGIIYEAISILNIDIDIFNNEWKLMAQISRIRLNPFFFFFLNSWITLTIHLLKEGRSFLLVERIDGTFKKDRIDTACESGENLGPESLRNLIRCIGLRCKLEIFHTYHVHCEPARVSLR